mmetsp:Transcript_163964/g.521247  ORF Transcript_163964/g.521247 Transcript_163964/m.521247 type:complete len:211 (+) Transcript_163964:301-933(+)
MGGYARRNSQPTDGSELVSGVVVESSRRRAPRQTQQLPEAQQLPAAEALGAVALLCEKHHQLTDVPFPGFHPEGIGEPRAQIRIQAQQPVERRRRRSRCRHHSGRKRHAGHRGRRRRRGRWRRRRRSRWQRPSLGRGREPRASLEQGRDDVNGAAKAQRQECEVKRLPERRLQHRSARLRRQRPPAETREVGDECAVLVAHREGQRPHLG